MQIFGDVSTWIVVPIVCALVFGKMLDAHYGTKPVIFLIFAGLGFLVTCFGMYRVVKDYMRKIQPPKSPLSGGQGIPPSPSQGEGPGVRSEELNQN